MTNKSVLEERIAELQHQCGDCISELAKKDKEIAILSAHVNDLQFQLLRSEMVGSLARRLFHEIDKNIMLKLTRDGQKTQKVRRSSLKINLKGGESYSQLLQIAKKYDIQEFFSYKTKVSKNSLRIHYRIVAKSYRVVRDGFLHIGGSIKKLRKVS